MAKRHRSGGPKKRAQVKRSSISTRLTTPRQSESPFLPIVLDAAAYNRAAALAFARAFWTKVNPDLHIGILQSPFVKKVPDGTVFERMLSGTSKEVIKLPNGNTEEGDWEDCAHFISNCLGTPPGGHTGGGLQIPSDFGVAYGTFSAEKLFQHLKSMGLINVIVERVTKGQAESKLSLLQAGDLIFYSPKTLAAHRHAGLFLGEPKKRIACHTYCRADQVDGFAQTWDSVVFTQNGTVIETLYSLATVR